MKILATAAQTSWMYHKERKFFCDFIKVLVGTYACLSQHRPTPVEYFAISRYVRLPLAASSDYASVSCRCCDLQHRSTPHCLMVCQYSQYKQVYACISITQLYCNADVRAKHFDTLHVRDTYICTLRQRVSLLIFLSSVYVCVYSCSYVCSFAIMSFSRPRGGSTYCDNSILNTLSL